MTYRDLLNSVSSFAAKDEAGKLCILNGYETEADIRDVDFVHETDIKAMGGLV